MSFAKYGKDGLAAGISNAAASLGMIVYSYLFSSVADNWGWRSVIILSIVLLSLAIIFSIIGFWQYRRFRKKDNL